MAYSKEERLNRIEHSIAAKRAQLANTQAKLDKLDKELRELLHKQELLFRHGTFVGLSEKQKQKIKVRRKG